MKVIYLNCGWRREYESDLRSTSNEHYLSRSEKKIQACTGILYRPEIFSGLIFTTAQVVFITA